MALRNSFLRGVIVVSGLCVMLLAISIPYLVIVHVIPWVLSVHLAGLLTILVLLLAIPLFVKVMFVLIAISMSLLVLGALTWGGKIYDT